MGNRYRSRSLVSNDGLVYGCLRRPGSPDGARSLPIIVLGGARGSGKSGLLREIEYRCRDLPHAWLDFEATSGMTRRDMFVTLWSELGMKRGQFGRIRFPRLMLGLLVRDHATDGRDLRPDPDRARREIKRLIEYHPLVHDPGSSDDRTPEQLSIELKFAIGSIKIPLSPVQRVIGWITSRLRLRKHFAAALAWYAERGRGDSYDALCWLQQASSEEADRILCEALLADLVAAYSRDRLAPRRTLNCMALLDNVQRDDGGQFLDLLVSVRHRLPASDAVPLVVIAATSQAHQHFVPEDSVQASAGWPVTASEDRCEVGIRDLTRDEIADLVPDGLDRAPQVVRLVHCLTRGHAGTVDLLVDAIEQKRRDGTAPLQLRGILDLPGPRPASGLPDGAASPTVAKEAQRRLLGDNSAGLLQRLVSWSAAHDIGQMVLMDGRHAGVAAEQEPITQPIKGWTRTEGATHVLHPLLRRLLLHELGARPANDPLNWDAVNALLRDDYENRLKIPPADADLRNEWQDRVQYHNLALGRMEPVVAHLRELLLVSDVGPWLDRLQRIASAPCRPFEVRPRDRVAELVTGMSAAGEAGGDEIRSIAELLACRWIASDPLGDPEHELLRIIRAAYERLAHVAVTRLGKQAFIDLYYDEVEKWQEAVWEVRCP